jgi:hypothetical protein
MSLTIKLCKTLLLLCTLSSDITEPAGASKLFNVSSNVRYFFTEHLVLNDWKINPSFVFGAQVLEGKGSAACAVEKRNFVKGLGVNLFMKEGSLLALPCKARI